MARTIHFNTGRMYTKFGQRITATLHSDGVITFWDHDRHIYGEFLSINGAFSQQSVMYEYDGNRYTTTIRSFQDGMHQGGCNTKYEGK